MPTASRFREEGRPKSLTLTQAVSPILAVVNNGDATIRLYALEGITGNSTPLLTLHTSPHPVALAFDPSGNLWVGGGSCAPGGPTGQFLEEFKAPFIEGEPPTLFPDLSLSGDVLTLAFDASDHLWVGTYRCSRIGLIQEYTPSSSGLMAGMFLTPAGAPAGLAFDAQGNLWVGLVFDQGSEIQEYLAPSFSNAQLYSLPQQTGGFASLALDAVGNLYGLVGSTGAPLEELPSGIQPPANGSNPFIQLFSLPSGIYGFGLAFDASGNLWLSSFNAKTRTGQVQEASFLEHLHPLAQPPRIQRSAEPGHLADSSWASSELGWAVRAALDLPAPQRWTRATTHEP